MSSRNSLRSNPTASRPSTPSHGSTQEDWNIFHAAARAAQTLQIDPSSFPSFYTELIVHDDLSEREHLIISILTHLVSRVRDLSEQLSALATRFPPATLSPAPAAPEHSMAVALRDLTSKVASLATRPPHTPALSPPSSMASQAPPRQSGRLLQSPPNALTGPSVDYPILVSGQWYGSPEAYARSHITSSEADIFFASVNPSGGEASKVPKKDGFPLPISQHFLPGPPPGYTVTTTSPPPPTENWAQVASSGRKGSKQASAAQVALASAAPQSAAPRPSPPLPDSQRHLYAPRTHPSPFEDQLTISASLPDIMASVLKSAGCTLPVSFAVSINANGAVTLTAGPHTPSSTYAPFFEALARKLNQSFPVGDNPFLDFRTAPLFTDVIFHNLPLSMLPQDQPSLLERLQESIFNATDASIL